MESCGTCGPPCIVRRFPPRRDFPVLRVNAVCSWGFRFGICTQQHRHGHCSVTLLSHSEVQESRLHMWCVDGKCFVRITHESLVVQQATDLATDPCGGAISVFVGTTRNNFDGKQVEKLEYEGYEPMALKCLQDVCKRAIEKWRLCKVVAMHRLGDVCVAEASVVIVASSPHRKAAIEACHWIIDELKATVPIWKKEFFTDGSSWKENAEWRALQELKAHK